MNAEQVSTIGLLICCPALLLVGLVAGSVWFVGRFGQPTQGAQPPTERGGDPRYRTEPAPAAIRGSGIYGRSNWQEMTRHADPWKSPARRAAPQPQQRAQGNGANGMRAGQTVIDRKDRKA